MIKVNFFTSGKDIVGFEISGHSGSAETGSDIICSAVSSAAYMAANTITEIVRCKAEADISDGYMSFYVRSDLSDAQQILEGLKLHLEALAADYPDNIKVTLRRCQNA
ncbi:MAG TPA: ribosomal-processing cysteine protease Prp [Ruminococcaceae bacterium]|nr:ribosomal-processing cysteine protease Prp [Oscillospiraceae bacterium]